jgi:translocator protein
MTNVPTGTVGTRRPERRRPAIPLRLSSSVTNVATEPALEAPSPGLTQRDAVLILSAVGATAGIGAGATASVLGSRWYRRLDKPPWQPPGPVFGPVWTVVYALIAASMLVARDRGGEGQRPLFVLFGTNLGLNLAWTLIFFRGRSPLAAGVEIIILESTTVALVVRAWPLSRLAALLLVPYAIWVAFATALTWAIWARNSRIGKRRRRRG